ncbi:MAG: hypothetical protein HC871_04050 [Rhizobiales bacterium]|nr:hypothetical protein [Hyphomicrobiales bacterium]
MDGAAFDAEPRPHVVTDGDADQGKALVQRRRHMLQMALHQVVGLASSLPNIADRSVWIDALVECPQHLVPAAIAKIGGMPPSFRTGHEA